LKDLGVRQGDIEKRKETGNGSGNGLLKDAMLIAQSENQQRPRRILEAFFY
jgi:hypothetical protein